MDKKQNIQSTPDNNLLVTVAIQAAAQLANTAV